MFGLANLPTRRAESTSLNTDASLILSPELDAIRQDSETLRTEVARLLVEAHDLVHIARPYLLALYQSKLGAWELRRLERQAAVARLKRKIALVQACVNRGEPVRVAAVEQQLETEFAVWQAKIADAAQALAQANHRLTQAMTPEDAADLRRYYHALVKRLHPDLHSNLDEPERLLWQRVQEAYKASNLEELRALALVLDEPPAAGPGPTPTRIEDQLLAERDALKAQVKRLLGELAAVRAQPPFTLQRDLEDDAWIAARRETLDAECAGLNQQSEELGNYLARLLPNDEHLPPVFGLN